LEEASRISPEASKYIKKLIPNSFSDIVYLFVLIIAILTYMQNQPDKPTIIYNTTNNITLKDTVNTADKVFNK
jgi:hypothetical protein